MQPIIPGPYQFQTGFGGSFVQEGHGDETHTHLPHDDHEPRHLDFDAILKALRSALKIR